MAIKDLKITPKRLILFGLSLVISNALATNILSFVDHHLSWVYIVIHPFFLFGFYYVFFWLSAFAIALFPLLTILIIIKRKISKKIILLAFACGYFLTTFPVFFGHQLKGVGTSRIECGFPVTYTRSRTNYEPDFSMNFKCLYPQNHGFSMNPYEFLFLRFFLSLLINVLGFYAVIQIVRYGYIRFNKLTKVGAKNPKLPKI
jgi:hypothetical protein